MAFFASVGPEGQLIIKLQENCHAGNIVTRKTLPKLGVVTENIGESRTIAEKYFMITKYCAVFCIENGVNERFTEVLRRGDIDEQRKDSIAATRVRPRPNWPDPLMGGGPPVRVGVLVGQIKIGRVTVGLRGERGGNAVTQDAMRRAKKAELYQRLV